MSVSAPHRLLTAGQIARQLNAPLHRVEYILRTREVRPIGRAGNIRVFAEADVEYIRAELRRIDAEREAAP